MRIFLITFLILITPVLSFADLRIDITKGNTEPIPIAFLDLNSRSKNEKNISISIGDVVKNNLSRSGLFSILPKRVFLEKKNKV